MLAEIYHRFNPRRNTSLEKNEMTILIVAVPARLTEHMEHVLIPIPGWNENFKLNEADCVMCSERLTDSRHQTSGMCELAIAVHHSVCIHVLNDTIQWKTLTITAVMTKVTRDTKWCQSRRDPQGRGPK